MPHTILLIGTLDTKGEELHFTRELIRARQQAATQSPGPDAFAGRTEKSV